MELTVGLLVIGLAVFAILRRAEVRLTMILTALALGLIAGHPEAIVETFLSFFTSEQFLVPIGCCLGFAYVLRQTGCDRHLVHLLARPVERIRFLLIPGVVLIAAVVNVPVVSQLSTAVLAGSVLVPILRAAGVSPVTTGAALLLGSSVGGELVNPGAPELRTIGKEVPCRTIECVVHVWPLLLVQLAVATSLFWILSLRAEARHAKERETRGEQVPGGSAALDVNVFKAMVPLVPLAILFLTALPPALRVLDIPHPWLVNPDNFKDISDEAKRNAAMQASFDSRLIGAAMLVGSVVAALTDLRQAGQTAKVFFEGAGYAFTHIISLIVAASCFGKGVKVIGLAGVLGDVLKAHPLLLRPAAVLMPLGFAWLAGSGMASTQSLFGFFVGPARSLGEDPIQVGAVVSLSAAAGRTMSPVAAVTLMCAAMTGADPLALVRRVALPLLAGILAVLGASVMLGMPR
jgi:DcuC family C4-dicarboxylate transporter